jgi:hypothetical protein
MYDQVTRKAFLAEKGYEHRTTAWRPDIAAAEFKGTLDSERYDAGTEYQCCVASTEMRFEPDEASNVETQLIYGNLFTVYDVVNDFAWGKSAHDGRVGFVPLACLTTNLWEATHWVSVPFTAVLPRPDRKAVPIMTLCLNAQVQAGAVSEDDDVYVQIGEGMWVFKGDLRATGDWFDNPVTPVLAFNGISSYIWGFRNGTGYDCSALTQAGWLAAGVATHHDADLQEADPNLGDLVEITDGLKSLRTHDQVYWPGHLAMMVSDTHAIHAKGSEMRRVIIEPIVAIDAWRQEEFGNAIRSVRRPRRAN